MIDCEKWMRCRHFLHSLDAFDDVADGDLDVAIKAMIMILRGFPPSAIEQRVGRHHSRSNPVGPFRAQEQTSYRLLDSI